jgi:small conductance mechanosensitive channel
MASVARSSVTIAVWTLAVLTILAVVGVQLGPYIAGLGIIGAALGFGAQDLVKDFLSGVFMLLEDQYGVGDVVDAGEATGTVEGITLRTTRVRSVDGTLWFVPNGEIRRLGNMSQGWARALLDISVAYDTDIDVASSLIDRVATGMATEPEFAGTFLGAPEVWGVENLAADSIDIRLVVRTTPGDQWEISRELRRRLKQAFDAEGIEIPFAQRTLWIRDQAGSHLPGTAEDVTERAGDGATTASGDAE